MNNLQDKLNSIKRRKSRFATPIIDKKIAWNVLLKIAKAHIHNFTIDNNNKEAYQQMFAYFTRWEAQFKGELKKGLFLLGYYGSGKSYAFEIFADFLDYFTLNKGPYHMGYNIIDVNSIIAEYKDQNGGGENSIKKYKSTAAWVFDDLGKDIKDGNYASHYANKINVMEQILSVRYKRFQNNNILTHCTTNFPMKSKNGKEFFKDAYGDYIADRFNEMFNVIVFKGKSRRK